MWILTFLNLKSLPVLTHTGVRTQEPRSQGLAVEVAGWDHRVLKCYLHCGNIRPAARKEARDLSLTVVVGG